MGRHQLSAQVDPEPCAEPSVPPPSSPPLNRERERGGRWEKTVAIAGKKETEGGINREKDNEKEL